MDINKLKVDLLASMNMYQGINSARTGQKLAIDYGVSIRLIQKAIESLRADGHPVCSNDNYNAGCMGYFIPISREEADSFFLSAKARARKTFISVANVAKALNAKFGVDEYQMELSL